MIYWFAHFTQVHQWTLFGMLEHAIYLYLQHINMHRNCAVISELTLVSVHFPCSILKFDFEFKLKHTSKKPNMNVVCNCFSCCLDYKKLNFSKTLKKSCYFSPCLKPEILSLNNIRGLNGESLVIFYKDVY